MARKPARLTPPFFHLLLSMSRAPKHGYAMMTEVAERTGGRITMGPSSLYYSLGRLEEIGLIREAEAPADGGETPHEGQRRYYELTDLGQTRLREEMEILEDLLGHARSLDLLS